MDFVRLSPTPPSATRARRLAIEATGDLPPDLADTIALLATELATNAILHAGTPFEFAIDVSPTLVKLCVRDESPIRPALKHYRPEDATGRGLALVEALSARWGVDMTDTGKSIWCDVTIPRSP